MLPYHENVEKGSIESFYQGMKPYGLVDCCRYTAHNLVTFIRCLNAHQSFQRSLRVHFFGALWPQRVWSNILIRLKLTSGLETSLRNVVYIRIDHILEKPGFHLATKASHTIRIDLFSMSTDLNLACQFGSWRSRCFFCRSVLASKSILLSSLSFDFSFTGSLDSCTFDVHLLLEGLLTLLLGLSFVYLGSVSLIP